MKELGPVGGKRRPLEEAKTSIGKRKLEELMGTEWSYPLLAVRDLGSFGTGKKSKINKE